MAKLRTGRLSQTKAALALLFVVSTFWPLESQGASGCGSRGGPGYRGPNGRCVGWDQLGRVCGSPPTLRCSSESVAIGAPEHADGHEKLRGELRSRRDGSGQPGIPFLQRP